MHASPKSALAGRRVLELADEKGMYCGKLLADMGADVIKIEAPGGDATRDIPPFWNDRRGSDRSLFFLYLNTSKRGVTLDVTKPAARDVFLRLAATADVVIETLAPGVLDALGLGYPVLRARQPGLVLTSITDFGQTGPRRHFRSADLVASALGGAPYVTGDAADPPVTLAGSQAFIMASTCAAAATLIALYRSARTGAGQQVDVSVQETVVAVTHVCGIGKWLDDGIVPRRGGTGLFASVPSGAYPCRDGLIYLMVNRPLHWKALAAWIHEVTGAAAVLDPLFEGPSSNRLPYRDLLDVYIVDLTQRFTVDEVYREGQRRHLAFTPVNTAAAVADDPHLAARGYFVDVTHAPPHGPSSTPSDAGRPGPLRYPGAPYRHSETPWRITRPAPAAGEHNAEIYGTELGLSAESLRAMEEAGIV